MRELFRDLRETLLTQRGRSLLGAGCAAVAVGAAALLLCALEGLDLRIQDLTSQFGERLVAITPPPGPPGRGRKRLDEQHVALLAANLRQVEVSSVRAESLPSAPGGPQVLVIATDDRYASIKGLAQVAGRGLDFHDVAEAERHCVLNPALARATGWQVGQVIYLGNLPFTVVGIEGSVSGGGSPDPFDGMNSAQPVALVPRSVPLSWQYDDHPRAQALDAILVQAPSAREVASTAASVTRLLEGEGFAPADYSIATAALLAAGVEDLRRALRGSGGAMVGLGFLLAGIALASLMMASVQERRWEVGLRRALGAVGKDIVLQFGLEAAAVVGAGSLAAVAIVNLAVSLLAPLASWPLAASTFTVLAPLTLALLFSALFSWLPIRRALQVPPAVALREL